MKERLSSWITHSYKIIPFCLLTGILLGAGAQQVNLDAVASPLLTLGVQLRALGMAGWWGNALLWVIVFAITLAPVSYAIWRQSQCKISNASDWLLVLLSAQLFAFLFCIVNPTYIPQQQGFAVPGAYSAVSIWAMLATSGSYCLLRFAVSIQNLTHTQTAKMLFYLLRGSGCLLLLLSTAGASQAFFAYLTATQGVNGGVDTSTMSMLLETTMVPDASIFVFAFVGTLQLFASILGALTLFWASDVAIALLQAPYQEQTVALCERRAKSCVAVVVYALLSGLACNLIQLMFFAVLQDVSIVWQIPLLPLLLAGSLFLLCHYVAAARALSKDNQLII